MTDAQVVHHPDSVISPPARIGPLSVAIETPLHPAGVFLPDVALSGLAGAGKDTAAQALVDELGYTVGKFAKPLYDAVLKLNPYDEHGNRLADRVSKHGWEVVKRNQPEARRLLQVFGTEVGRDMFGQDFWVDRAAAWRSGVQGPVVWTDCRFPNEVDYVQARCCGLWVHIERPGQQVEGAGHASEGALAERLELATYDFTILNDGGLATLHHRILAVIDRVAG